MKYIYGPVKSRRLGLSLGLTITPHKTCSFNCVYCQLGATAVTICERKEFFPTQEIIDELRGWLEHNAQEALQLNYITLSGAGEPTLNSNIGTLVAEIKRLTNIPLALITNASFLSDKNLRSQLLGLDLIVPSLDAPTDKVFQRIDRPHPGVSLEAIIQGLIDLRKEFSGKIWLEVMLVKGFNDDLRYIKRLKEIIERINPDKIQLNSPVRSTAEPGIIAVDKSKLKKIKDILGEKAEII